MQKLFLILLFCGIVFSDMVMQVVAHLNGDLIVLDISAEKETKLEKEKKKLEMKDFFITYERTPSRLLSASHYDHHDFAFNSLSLEVQSPPPEERS